MHRRDQRDGERPAVITVAGVARRLRERGRIASPAGHKRAAIALYRRAERCERLARHDDGGAWTDWQPALRR